MTWRSLGLLTLALALSGSTIQAQAANDVEPMRVAIARIVRALREHERIPSGIVRIDGREIEVYKFASPGSNIEVDAFRLAASRDSSVQSALLAALSAK